MSLNLENLKGVGPTSVSKLKDAGIMNIQVLATASIETIKSLGYGATAANKLLRSAREHIDEINGGTFGFICGDELVELFDKRRYLKTGEAPFDHILGGGFETQKVYELYGPEGSGKSSLCLQLAVLSMRSEEQGGLRNPCTVILDCEGAYSPKRITFIAEYYGLVPRNVIRAIARAEPATSDALLQLAEMSLPKIMEQTGARLIILDSIATHFRSEYGAARQEFPLRQQKANRVIHALKRAATNYNAVAILTNQVTGNVNAGPFSSPYKHSMGYTVGHESQIRIKIAPRQKAVKKIFIEKAVDLANEEAYLELTGAGFINTPECDKFNENDDVKSPEWHAKQAKGSKTTTTSKKTTKNIMQEPEDGQSEKETPEAPPQKKVPTKTKKAKKSKR